MHKQLRQIAKGAVFSLVLALLLAAPAGAATRQAVAAPGVGLLQQLALQRATQAVLWGMPALSLMALRRGAERDLGAQVNDVIYMSQPLDAKHAFLTANNQTPYVMTMLDTRAGPVVVEVPPASPQAVFFGSVVDAWQVPVVDIGPQGDDAGRGGKYLFVPPGYDQPIPEGYLGNRVVTHRLYVGLRPVAVGSGTLADAVEYSKRLKVYPLAQAAAPVANRYIDAFPHAWDTLPKYDAGLFADLATLIAEEPVQARVSFPRKFVFQEMGYNSPANWKEKRS